MVIDIEDKEKEGSKGAPEPGRVPWMGLGLLVAMAICFCAASGAASAALLYRLFQRSGPAPAPQAPPGDSSLAGEMLERLKQVEVPVSDPIELARALRGLGPVPRVLAAEAAPLAVGTVREFWVSDVDRNEARQVRARLVASSPHLYFWIAEGVDYQREEVQALVDAFEERIYPQSRRLFGSEWTPGVDGDPHLYVLYAPGLGDSVAGYFSANDSFPPQIFEFTNGHEMFYLNADTLDLGWEDTAAVLAHEFQHAIQWNVDRNEQTWISEGLAELNALLNGYAVGGFDALFVRNPDLPLTYWPSDSTYTGEHYGQAFLFAAYLWHRLGEEGLRAWVADPRNGMPSLDVALRALGLQDEASGAPLDADDLALEWAVAMLVQDPSVADGRYAFAPPLEVPRPRPAIEVESCPTEQMAGQVNQFGVDYIRLRCQGSFTLTLRGVEQIQVVPAEPHSGRYMFWSNRGDVSTMTLSRTFDFREVEGPLELRYWTWFDIEQDYDYLYVTASTDGGRTFEILTTPSGTGTDPSGNSYGWGYTGPSGGQAPRWIEEAVDISPLAGKEAILRFIYVTDAAVNGEGFLLDDVSIPALGYEEDFEEGQGGWEGEGFVHLYNRIPQSYRLAIVEYGAHTTVRKFKLDGQGPLLVPLDIGGEVRQVDVVIMGTTRYTWQPARYWVEIQGRGP